MAGIYWAFRMPQASFELCNLILVEPFSGGKGCFPACGSGSPPIGVMAWLNCIMSDPMAVASILDTRWEVVHCLLVACEPSRWSRRRQGAGSKDYVEMVSDPWVEIILVIDGDRVGVEKHLAFCWHLLGLPPPHKSQKLIYEFYIFAQLSVLLLVQLNCWVKPFIWSAIFTRFNNYC